MLSAPATTDRVLYAALVHSNLDVTENSYTLYRIMTIPYSIAPSFFLTRTVAREINLCSKRQHLASLGLLKLVITKRVLVQKHTLLTRIVFQTKISVSLSLSIC